VLVRPRGAADLAGSECLFCPGNEARTPPEIAAYRKEGSAPNSPGWQVRVVPDVDPCFRVEWDLVREGVGMYDRISPRGAAELIIESPSHDDTPATMGADQIERVLWMYRDRLADLKRDLRIRDVLATRRHAAGPVVTHPHSRVTAIPVIFDVLRRELRESQEYYRYKRRCLFCDIVRQELGDESRVVRLTPWFLAVIPYAARAPFETWILPRQHQCAFEETLSPEAAGDLARLLDGYFGALASGLGNPSFELSLHTAPNLQSKLLPAEWATIRDDYHWHFEVVVNPEGANRLGGIFTNDVPPEEASRRLREVWR
jgi:UDPglucose--hexose-1-phosphate uridylyltransferase